LLKAGLIPPLLRAFFAWGFIDLAGAAALCCLFAPRLGVLSVFGRRWGLVGSGTQRPKLFPREKNRVKLPAAPSPHV